MEATHRTSGDLSSAHTGLLAVIVCLLFTMASGCRPAAVSYEDLCGFTSEQLGAMEEEDVRRWLEATYGREVFRDATAEEVSLQPAWTQEDGFVTAHLRDGKLSHARFAEIKGGPAFDQIVAGLGAPEVIIWGLRIYGGHVLYSFALHYPSLGVSVEGWREMTGWELSRPAEEWTGVLRKDMQVDWVDCYLPCSSVEETLADVFGLSPDQVQLEMKRQMPWPGFGSRVPLTVEEP